MALATLCALALLAASAPTSLGCLVPPQGCRPSVCASYASLKTPNSVWNYTNPATWRDPTLKPIGFYRGVFNKLVNGGNAPPRGSYASWMATRAVSGALTLNFEKFEIPATGFQVRAPYTTSLKDCCDDCRKTKGCVIYAYYPASTAAYSPLTGGSCYLLNGGRWTSDGPYNPRDAKRGPYGTPFSGTNTQQASSKNPMGYVGGFCNPGNDTTNVVDDPHFTGAHGTRFDFNGELNKPFCLTTDRTLHINAVLKGYKNTNEYGATVAADGKALRSWIRELGFLWTDGKGNSHALHLVARDGKEQKRGSGFLSSAGLDGVPVAVPQQPGASFKAADLTLTYLGMARKGPYEMDRFQLKIGQQLDMQLTMRVAHAKLQAADDAEAHFNLMFTDIHVSENIHGVLGQTYRNSPSQIMKAVKYSELSRLLGAPVKADGASGAGFLEGAVRDYEASHVLKADCKVSSFLKASA